MAAVRTLGAGLACDASTRDAKSLSDAGRAMRTTKPLKRQFRNCEISEKTTLRNMGPKTT